MKPTQEQVIAWARETGIPINWPGVMPHFEQFATLAYEAGRKDEREKVAQWMMQRSYATGHGDTTEDLLVELEWQIAENWNRAMINGVETEREACAKVCEELGYYAKHGGWGCADAIRARREQ